MSSAVPATARAAFSAGRPLGTFPPVLETPSAIGRNARQGYSFEQNVDAAGGILRIQLGDRTGRLHVVGGRGGESRG